MHDVRDMEAEAVRVAALLPEDRAAHDAALIAHRIDLGLEDVDTPEVNDFIRGLVIEGAHQRSRWGSEHDAGKEPEDWLWLIGWLVGKAARAAREGDAEKAKHHCISTAAAMSNWHAQIMGTSTAMRPGIDPAEHGLIAQHQHSDGEG